VMKYSVLGTISCSALLAACSVFHKTEPVSSGGGGLLVLPSEEIARQSGASLKDLRTGFDVWIHECGKCHLHALPAEFPQKEWHAVKPGLVWNANISDEEEAALLKYMIAAKNNALEENKRTGELEKLAF
jgi:hypothetical protein